MIKEVRISLPGSGSFLPNFGSKAPVKRLLGDPLDKLKDTVRDVITNIVPKETPSIPSIDFGKKGRDILEGSLFIREFLGSLASGRKSGGPRPDAKNESGSRIPGGPELYRKGKGMYHKGAPGAPDTYAFENSPAGIKFAAENGYESIDIDMLITKDGVPVATHYARPMEKDGFYDPQGKLAPNTRVSEMTLAEVRRLRNKDGESQIYSLSTMVELLKKHGIAGDLEAKNDPRFADDQMMGQIADLVRDTGIRANLKTIDYGPQAYQVLEAAQRQGFWVRTASGNERKARHFGYGE